MFGRTKSLFPKQLKALTVSISSNLYVKKFISAETAISFFFVFSDKRLLSFKITLICSRLVKSKHRPRLIIARKTTYLQPPFTL